MKRVVFISAFDYPTKYAHARHGLEMARAYHAIYGDDFTFVINTTTVPLPVPYVRLFGPFGRRIKLLRLRRALIPIRLFFFFLVNPAHSVVVTDAVLFAPLVHFRRFFKYRLVCECHGSLSDRQAQALQAADLAVFTTKWLFDKYATAHTPAVIAPNAVDLAAFQCTIASRTELRSDLGLPDGFMIGYLGRFEPLKKDKGLRFLIDVMVSMQDVQLLLVGGSRQEIPTYEAYAVEQGVRDRVHFVTHVDAARIPKYAKACDALAYVPTERSQFFEHETSPMKVFEYMAAECPIILSDTRALREILDDEAAFFIQPGSRDEFMQAVDVIRRGEGEARARIAFEKVQGNTWLSRAKRIVETLNQ